MTELARGKISDRPWGLTLGALGVRGLTGVVRLTSESKLFSIRFEGGAVIDATSSLISDSAARVAMTCQMIGAAEVGEIVRVLALTPDRDELEVVAQTAGLTSDQIDELRRHLIAQRAARTFSLTDGELVVTTTAHTDPACALDVRPLIYLGALLHMSDDRIEHDLGGAGARFQLKEGADAELPAYGFTAAEGHVVTALAGGASLGDLDRACHSLDHHTVCAVVYALVSGLACRVAEQPSIAMPRTDTRRVASKIDPNTSFNVPSGAGSTAGGTALGRTKSSPGRLAIVERSRSRPTGDVGTPGSLRSQSRTSDVPARPTATEPSPFDDIDLARKSGQYATVKPPAEAEPLAESPFDEIELARRSRELEAVAPPPDDNVTAILAGTEADPAHQIVDDAAVLGGRRTAAMWATGPFDAEQLEALAHEAEALSPATAALPRPRTRTEQLLIFAAIPREPSSRNLPAPQTPLRLDDPLADIPLLDDALLEPLPDDLPPDVAAPAARRWLRAGTESAWLPLELRRPALEGGKPGKDGSGSDDR